MRLILLSVFCSLIASSLGLARPCVADEFPTRPVHLIVPYPAGGNVDVTARIIQEGVSRQLGAPLIVENRPGAGAQLGGQYVARSDPDGYTLLIASTGPVVLASLVLPDPLYRWQDAFAPVGLVSLAATTLVVSPSLPVSSLTDFIAYAKANPDTFSLGTGGAGSINHMASELLQQMSGVKWTQIHYPGDAPAANDVVGGHIAAAMVQLSSAMGNIQGGNLKAIAVFSERRTAILPQVPTAIESGFPGLLAANFVGVLAPKATQQAVIDKVSAAIRSTVSSPEVAAKFEQLGSEAQGSTSAGFRDFLTAESAKWSEVVAKGHIKVQ